MIRLFLILYFFASPLILEGSSFLKPKTKSETVKTTDFSKNELKSIISKLFELHFTYDRFNPELVKRVSTAYINELDPLKIYFLKDEINDWLEPSDEQLEQRIHAWSRGDFSEFFTLTSVFIKAIERRALIEGDFKKDTSLATPIGTYETFNWSENEEELKTNLAKLHIFQMQVIEKVYKEPIELKQAPFHKWRVLKEKPFLSIKKVFEGHVYTLITKSIASSLDSHTCYYTEEEATEVENQLNRKFSGIGVMLEERVQGYKVTQILDQGPAKESGLLLVDDIIIAIDDQPIVNLPISEGVKKIMGKPGSPVRITLMRKKELLSPEETSNGLDSLEITLKRQEIILEKERLSRQIEPYGDGVIAIIGLHSFYADDSNRVSDDLRAELQKLKAEYPLKAIVLDLRYNVGGYIEEAINVAGNFLSPGVVSVIGNRKGELQYLRSLNLEPTWQGPLVVLVNRASASASEIVTAILKDYQRSITVGDSKTNGKGSYQLFLQDPSNKYRGVLNVTQGLYYTVSGQSPQLEGIEPNIVISGPLEYEEIGEKYSSYPITPDFIDPSFEDSLSDLNYFQKRYLESWYFQHQQKIQTQYFPHIEILKSNSSLRQNAHSDYQKYLDLLKKRAHKTHSGTQESDSQEKLDTSDYQLREALNVTKDLLQLLSAKAPTPLMQEAI